MKEYDLEGFLELNKRLEVLFQCHLMELAGMKLKRIKEIVKNNRRIQYKLGLLSDKEKA